MRSKALHILSILLLFVSGMTTARAQGSHPTPDEEKNGITFNGNTYKPQSRIKIAGNVYGGGDQAAVEGNTHVIINTGEYGGEIFGGGNGAMEADGVTVKRSADVGKHDAITGELVANTGDTYVTINGGEIVYYIGAAENGNHNIYGGGNLACNVAGNTHVSVNKGMITAWSFVSSDKATAAWQSWYDDHKADQKSPMAAVFGAGYGANTDVAKDTHVDINIGKAHSGEYNKTDLVTINGYIVRERPNPLLSQNFVTAVLGGGYNGTVGAYSVAAKGINRDKDEYIANTNVTITGSPYMFNVFGGGLGSKEAADKDGNKWDSHVGAVYGGTKVDIQGGFVYGDVFGGGAGINGQMEVALSPEHTGMMPYINAAQVFRETDLTISGNGTVIIGNVYGGGDIANTGWYTAAARPTGDKHQVQENMSLAKLDYTTSLKLKGGNIMGAVFAGANGRKKTDIAQAHLIGAVIGSTNLTFGNDDESGATVWNNIYAGGNAGCVYSCADIAAAKNDAGNARAMASYEKDSKTFYVKDGCTNAAFYGGKMAKDIFGGGFGDVSEINPSEITSADISGNTYVYFKQGQLEFEEYWDPTSGTFKTQTSKDVARNTESDICHNLYGGGNVACIVKGNTHVHMEGAPSAPPSFALLDYYEDCISNVAKPHFSSFGGGFGKHAEVRGDTHSDINLKYGTGMHSIIGGGMNGPVGGYTKVHVGSDPSLNIHHVYGGGYYASCKGTQLDITRGNIVENVFGGSVMGNINEDGEITDIVTETTIGLQTPGDGRHSSADLEDESGTVLRSYAYDDQHPNEITIGGNVYGANDVSGTVNGIAKLTIYGGTFKSEVYGAGNGNHIGYYIPAQLRYDLGEHDNNYYYVDHTGEGGPEGNTYVSRPQTLGGVELTLEGNTETERVSVLGQVFGGGNSCTIGEWDKSMIAAEGKYHGDPHLTRDDPAYFQGGGKIDIMLGSHVTIGRKRSVLNTALDGSKYIDNDENVSGLFMGCSGKDLATQSGAKTDNHYHHFFSPYANQYLPGFLVYDEHGIAKDREEQLKPFQAYLNNILVWTDDINLRFKENAEDIWLANFVGGGFRGSMRLKESTGRFDYRLPIGVTVNHAIIGGAYNSHVKYKLFATNNDGSFVDSDGDDAWDYATTVPDGWTEGVDYIKELKEDPEHPEKTTAILRYNYNGGMLSENSTGLNESLGAGAHIHTVHADPRTTPAAYETAYFEPKKEGQEGREDDATRAKLFTANKEKTLLYLQLNCALEPEVFEADAKHDKKYANGGNVYGGCFSSGFVEGDSWVDYSCWLSPNCTDQTFFGKQNNLEIYAEVADLDRNNAMSVFGAGFGSDTHSMGDVYLRIKNINNAALGDADPNDKFPYIYNAFGGSNMGEVDGNVNVYYDTGAQGTLLGSLYGGSYQGGIGGNTFVELASGFLFNVYGGSRKANIKGASHVWAYDGFYRGAPDAQHLIVCNLYGGNDIAGTIEGTMPIAFTKEKWNGYAKRSEVTLTNEEAFNTYVEVSTDSKSERGFPLIGSAYAGGNGLNWKETEGVKPEVVKALIEIGGGSTLNAFGGGNMATVTGKTCIFANAEGDTYANVNFTEYQKYIVQNVFFNGMKRGYRWDGTRLILDPFHVMNLFGGNNLATMDIQPTWNLAKGRLENVYSGGNMGDMTYYNPAGRPSTRDGAADSPSGVEDNADGSNSNYTPRGLSITIEQPDIFIQSLFGGCRMSNVTPTPKGDDIVNNPWPTTNADDYYGATVNVTDGYINNIYGGNDISGTVAHGTNVNISGAVSGNVYGSGNGFYLYKYDPEVTQVTEELDNSDGGYGIYYRVPETDANGDLLDKRGTPSTDTHKILTINAIRPSVEKAFLNIGGLEHYTYKDQYGQDSIAKRVAYVKGNVFCGGNASTITGDGSFSKFKIGSFVTLNGVFMGSDGLAYTENDEIARFAKINGITDMGAATSFNLGYELDHQHNPILLNTYMMAVDMKAQPRDFNLNLPLKEAHIGTYCGGGNRGSMLVDKTVELPFHHDIIIYDKIVGACLNANVEYNQNGKIITSYGGYTRAIDLANNGANGNTKMRLNIASQFVPLVMDVPDDKDDETLNSHGENFETAKTHDFLYDNRTEGVKYTYQEFNELFETEYTSDEDFFANEGEDHWWKEAPGIYAPSCNIYGGCYQSGEVEGDIELNLYSNMLRYVDKEDLDKSLAQNIACFNVYGAGFGQNSHVWGNVKINMDRCLDTSTMGDPVAKSNLSPEIATLLGGEFNWDVQHSTNPAENMLGIDNAYQYPSFNNIIGGGRNGKLIGNSTVEIRNGLVYSDVAGGCYASDMYGSTHVIVGYPQYWECNTSGEYDVQRGDTWNTTKEDVYGGKVVKQTIKYLKGDLVPNNVYEQIIDGSKNTNFTEVTVTPANWDDIHIKIGKGVYGGGYSLANSTAASAGSITTHKLKDDNIDLHPHNFDGRYGLDIASTIGYGGNSSIMLGDQNGGTRDHIHVSTLNVTPLPKPYTASTKIGKYTLEDGKYNHQGDGTPDPSVQYYELSGDGGLYGDGHLTFCEGFRSADVTRYGWAEGTAKHPVLLNTFQRMDLLSINDCCLMLQGAQDFATDQIDATVYSITRINELRMNSSLDATQKLGEISAQDGLGGVGDDFDRTHQRNYLAFFNNVHYLGSIVTNDKFTDAEHTFHDADGTLGAMSYKAKKQDFISTYSSSLKQAADVTEFKQRNVGTARNAIGINNGYCLRIQNQEYVGSGDEKQSQTYYGPIVGVCEVKLLTLVQGEGGGYVYADNIHNDPNNFLMTSGNFVFPGIVSGSPEIGNQYIVDDCFLKHFGTTTDLTQKNGELDEAHYWYVEGNKYFFTTTLTGFTYQEALDFNLTDNDPNIILSGMENGSQLNIKKIEWLSTHRNNYECVLENATPDKIDDYEFDIQIGGVTGTDWTSDMPRYTAGTDLAPLTTGKTIQNDNLPQFNILLQDKLDNSGDAKYINHLDEPEVVKLYLEGETQDEHGNWQTYEYTITLNIVYLQGPTFEGGVRIENCALPGEWINFSSDGLDIKTPELMPITAASWQIVPLQQIDEHGVWHWDISKGTVIPGVQENLAGNMEGHITALYKQNEYAIAYIFTAGGKNFPVMPKQTNEKKEERMIVVHNYHRMKDVVSQNLQIETMVTAPNHSVGGADEVYHPDLAQAKLYIEDEEDLRAFINYLNMATATYTDGGGVEHEGNEYNIPIGLTGLDIILQKDIKLTSALPDISVSFAGNFHGDGYHIDLNGNGGSFLGANLTGNVYNLGLVGGTIATTGTLTNCYEYVNNDAFTYGQMAYDLSHHFTPTADGYVEGRYANGDYQYATTDRVWSLRTGAPNYGQAATHHNCNHTHDANRWHDGGDDDGDGNATDVDILAERGANMPLYDGTKVIDNVEIKNNIGEVTDIKYGLPENYANDYLFFGQHLDKENADAYPVHIDGKANGDADYAKGGNRIYKTSGFYGSATDQSFYYNKDAWALQPTLTAIDFTFRNGDEKAHNYNEQVFGRCDEGDDTSTASPTDDINQPKWFSVDSNADYNGGTYDNASYGQVSQNLIVVGENATENPDQADVLAGGTYEDGTAEEDIRYHRVQLKNGSTGVYEIDYFHLVDKQDYNSPVSYTVNQRAWYERYPQTYRNVTPDPTEPTYQTPSAWEGITLPFQYIEKVSGEPQIIKGETYENVLSHFYGETTQAMDENPAINDRTLHHEYWLTGLVGAADGKASFARPTGTDGTDNFYIGSSYFVWPFNYENNYYRHLSDYGDYSDTRDDDNDGADAIGQHDNDWYFTSHEFADYPRQNQGTPYLCAFPGEDFYEFSLEGQKITFEKVGTSIIAVSDIDINTYGTTTVGSHSHVGTYTHVPTDASHLGINAAGNAFEVATGQILPFRTYMTSTSSAKRILIVDDGIEETQPEKPAEELVKNMKIRIVGTTLIVESNCDATLPVYTPNGNLVVVVNVKPGTTKLPLNQRGVYIIANRKHVAW